ncbi:MAG: hypothetical protein PHD88_10410 [Firmicutes bacterium]|nr:hypothetical protein [Bacillota bacterium]MDD4264300.1 hypothetical protein [Bacillota bacterium]MDD4694773.1 hypothetical protein [Bacillota bacterium]
MRTVKEVQVLPENGKLKIVRQVEETEELTLQQLNNLLTTAEANLVMYQKKVAEEEARVAEIKDLLKLAIKVV